jgi:hypothetical protein
VNLLQAAKPLLKNSTLLAPDTTVPWRHLRPGFSRVTGAMFFLAVNATVFCSGTQSLAAITSTTGCAPSTPIWWWMRLRQMRRLEISRL